ncbi:MAG: PAS domain S-box protein, partial [Planctomycetia bacterium]
GCGLRWTLDPILGDSVPYSIAVISGVVLARFSGFWPGCTAVCLGVIAGRYCFMQPRGSFAFEGGRDLVGMGIPVAGGLFIAWLMDKLKSSQEQSERQSRELLQGQQDHERELAERRQVEARLRATKADLRLGQEEFRTLAEKSPVGIFRTDLDGACTFVNEYWCQLSRLSVAETMGTGWARAIHPDDVAEFVRRWQACLRQGQPFIDEYRILRPDGEVRAALTAAQPVFDEQGRLAHYVGIVMDMTERKAAYDSLARKQSLLRKLMESQEREKSLLCHEFHDGLIQYAVASLMMLESCREGCGADTPPAVSETIDNVIRFLTAGVDDGRRVIRGIRTAVLDDLGLEAAIDDLVDLFAASGISCDKRIDLGPDELDESLQTTVYRIVQESLSNARRHSAAGRVTVSLVRHDDELRLSIGDDGCGFDPVASRGRGFGIIGIEERTMLADGTCRIDSAPGRGATILVRLPVALAGAARSEVVAEVATEVVAHVATEVATDVATEVGG